MGFSGVLGTSLEASLEVSLGVSLEVSLGVSDDFAGADPGTYTFGPGI